MSNENMEVAIVEEKETQVKEFKENNHIVISEKFENELRLINEKFSGENNKVMQILRDNKTASFLKVKNLSEAGLITAK